MHAAAEIILLYMVVPAWLAFGLADWWCHRHSDIAHTTGIKESAIHLLMYAEGALALLAGLLLEINAGILAFLFLLLIMHEITGIWDLTFANPRREITTIEQHMHSFLEVLPFMAIGLVCVMHWEQFKALFGFSLEPVSFSIEWKHERLPLFYTGAVIGAAFIFDLVPYGEEFWRCWKAIHGKNV